MRRCYMSLRYERSRLARKRRGACISVLRRVSLPGGLRVYRSNEHLAAFLKPILNKMVFPDVILVCHTVVDMTGWL